MLVLQQLFNLSDGGVDAAFSMEPLEMKNLVIDTRTIWQALGTISYGPTESELSNLKFRCSIYTSRDISAGEKFSVDNIRVVRPGDEAPHNLQELHWGLQKRNAGET